MYYLEKTKVIFFLKCEMLRSQLEVLQGLGGAGQLLTFTLGDG